MICMSCIRPLEAPDQRPSTLAGRLVEVVKRAWRAYWSRRAGRAIVLLLSALDQGTRHAMGFDAAEIACLAKHGRLLERGAERRRCG